MATGRKSVSRIAFEATLVVATTLLTLWVLYEIRQVLITVLVALVFAAAIAPLVAFLVARRIPRAAAVLMVYLALLGVLAGVLLVVVPPLARETAELVGRLVDASDELDSWIASLSAAAGLGAGAPLDLGAAFRQALQASASLAPGLLRVTFGALTGILGLLLVLAVAFYWLMERADVERAVLRLIPLGSRTRTLAIWREIEVKLGAYVRGQLLDAMAVGVVTFLGLLVLRVEFALPLALIAATTGLIPIVGATLGAVPALLVGLSQSPQTALLVLGLYVVIQQLEGNLLAPKIMERSVGVSPLTVLLAIVIGGSLLGVIGAMLAIPTAAALQVLVLRLILHESASLAGARAADATGDRGPGEDPADRSA